MTTRAIVRYKPRPTGVRRVPVYRSSQFRTNPYFKNSARVEYRHRKSPGGLAGVVFLIAIGICLAYFISMALPKSTAVSNGETTAQSINYSKALVRVDQTKISSYRDTSYFADWAMSACSAAAMTEIINAYNGTHYSISDILAVETAFRNPTVLTTQLGLMYPGGIDRTMAHYGIRTNSPTYTLQQMIDTANAGTPVLVSFPPETFDGGHILDVIGGDGTYVHLADSSSLNMQYMTRGKFLSYWRGFAKTFYTPAQVKSANIPVGQHSILGIPSLSPDKVNSILCKYASPACDTGAANEFYKDSLTYGIDDKWPLAFFQHESNYGVKGMAAITHSIGNLRCIDGAACVNTAGNQCQLGQSCYAAFPDWSGGVDHWYILVSGSLYVGDGRVTIEQIIPRYAPAADNNDESEYIRQVLSVAYGY